MVYKFFEKKTANKSAIKSIPQAEQLAEELHKPLIRIFEKKKCIQHSNIIFGLQIWQICN